MCSFARANDAKIMRSIAGMRNAILRKNLQCVSSCYKLVLFGQSKLEANSWDSFLTQGRFPRLSPVECTLYAGLLLFPAVAVFAKLSTNHGWLLFPRFSLAVLFTTGYTYFILRAFQCTWLLPATNVCYKFHYLVRLFAAALNSSTTILELA